LDQGNGGWLHAASNTARWASPGRNRSQRGRAESEAAAERARPIENPDQVDALLTAAKGEGGANYLVTLHCLDAGLRLREATALDWEDVEWGRRALRVQRSLSRGKHLGPTNSGRSRSVALSRRLMTELLKAHMAAGRPSSGTVALVEHANYRHRALRRMIKASGIAQSFTPHGLRDTYASHLLSAGVQLAYVSNQLGHADVAITARHYAQWCGGDEYRPPIPLGEGEVPADLLARLAKGTAPSAHTAGEGWSSHYKVTKLTPCSVRSGQRKRPGPQRFRAF
jgi:integrase